MYDSYYSSNLDRNLVCVYYTRFNMRRKIWTVNGRTRGKLRATDTRLTKRIENETRRDKITLCYKKPTDRAPTEEKIEEIHLGWVRK